MIYIKEIENGYLGGSSSINISFDYNEDIINIIKSCDVYNYDKKTKTWEITVNDLAYIIDNLTYFDDLNIELINNISNSENNEFDSIESFTPLFPHQVEGIKYFLKNKKGLLLDEPGLGKSLQGIIIARELKKRENLEHCLILCGINSLKQNWKKEIQKHSDLSCIIIGEKINSKGNITYTSIKERANQLVNKIDEFFVILNIESLRENEIIDAINNSINKFDMIIVDEIHRCLDGKTLIDTNMGFITIEDIVCNKIKCKVKSYNYKTKKLEYNEILNYYNNGLQELMKLDIEENGKIYSLKCTSTHKIYTLNRGWVEAKDLTDKDNILVGDLYEG